MSSPRFRVELAAHARRDWESILAHTLQTWGEAQMVAYENLLENALETLRWYPNLGHRREGVSEHHRVFIAGQHVIVYVIAGDVVSVSRILHEKMDIARHLAH